MNIKHLNESISKLPPWKQRSNLPILICDNEKKIIGEPYFITSWDDMIEIRIQKIAPDNSDTPVAK